MSKFSIRQWYNQLSSSEAFMPKLSELCLMFSGAAGVSAFVAIFDGQLVRGGALVVICGIMFTLSVKYGGTHDA